MTTTPPATFTISAHSLGVYDRCARAYFNYKIIGRKAVRSQGGMLAGSAIHAAIHVLQSGGSVAEQEQAITDVLLEAPPLPPEDHRTPGYLRDGLAAFRAEFNTLFAGWVVEEGEVQGTVPLGTLCMPDREVTVFLEFRRDMVGVSPAGDRYIVDFKTASRDEDAHYLAFKNSGQLLGYLWSWQTQHPDKPVAGVLPIRIILRRPSRTGVTFAFPHDPPILFEPARVAEWRRHTLNKIRCLLSRDPQNPDDWPLSYNELGGCRTQFGVCDYLSACVLPAADRTRMLMSDAFEPADAGKPK